MRPDITRGVRTWHACLFGVTTLDQPNPKGLFALPFLPKRSTRCRSCHHIIPSGGYKYSNSYHRHTSALHNSTAFSKSSVENPQHVYQPVFLSVPCTPCILRIGRGVSRGQEEVRWRLAQPLGKVVSHSSLVMFSLPSDFSVVPNGDGIWLVLAEVCLSLRTRVQWDCDLHGEQQVRLEQCHPPH